jgi:hypothetical protein
MPRVTIGPFSIDAPLGWTLSTVILAGPTTDPSPTTSSSRLHSSSPSRSFQQNLAATMEQVGPGVTLRSYLERQIDGLIKANVGRSEAEEPQEVTLPSGRTGLLSDQYIQTPGGDLVRQLQLVCIKDGVAYTLIATHLAGELYERARDEFLQLLLSFE